MIHLLILTPFFYGTKWKDQTDIYSKENGLYLRGLAIIFIVLHHIYLCIGNSGPLAHIGHLSVSVFFFLSGYGLLKKTNLDGFWKKRLVQVYFPFVLSNVIFIKKKRRKLHPIVFSNWVEMNSPMIEKIIEI